MMPGYRQPRPYGPPPFFGPEIDDPFAPQGQAPAPQPAVNPWLPGVGAGPGVGYDAGAGVEQSTIAPEPQGSFEEWSPSQGQAPTGAQPPAGGQMPEGDYPSEADIERRLRLAKALMGQQQEVNHPLQAIGNAVNQIAGAYLENKAAKDREGIENRRRDAFKKAFGGSGSTDLEALADELLKSNDPALVDKGLEIKLALATQGRQVRKPPTVRDFPIGDQQVPHEWNEETGQWEPIEGMGGPRWRDDTGGGSGPGQGKRQQGGAFQLPDGDVVAANFNPGDGQYYYQDKDGKMVPVPPGSRPVNPSTGGSQTPSGWLKLKKERQEGINALLAIQKYSQTTGGLPQGFRRWATDLSARWKTFLGQKGLTQEQFDLLDAKAKQQALLGMLRTTIVGPGVMTEYDAMRIIEAMGGNPGSAMQNPEVLAKILADLYDRKMREVKVLDDEYRRVAPTFGETPEPMGVPEKLDGSSPSSVGPGGQPSRPRFKDGDTKTIIDREGKFGPKGARVTFKRVNGNWTIVR